MSVATLARTFTRTAECGHAYEAPSMRGRKILCGDCRAVRGSISVGAWVNLGGGAVGQVWSEGSRAGAWWIATGSEFIEMSDAAVIRNMFVATSDDIDALFESGAVGAVIGMAAVVATWGEALDEIATELDAEPTLVPTVDARPVAVTESYRQRTHDVDHGVAGSGAVMTRCGILLATDPNGQAARRGAVHGTVHGQDRIGETMCGQCVAVAEAATYGADALRPVVAAVPVPAHADTRTDTGRVVSEAPADAPAAILTIDIYGRGCIVVRTDVATVLRSAQRDGWQEWDGVGAGRSRTFEDGSPVADAVRAVLAAVQGYDRVNAPGGNPFPYGRDVAELAGWSCPVIPADVWDPMTRHYVAGAHAEGFAGILPVGRAASAAHYAGESDDDRECGWEFYG